MKEDKAYQDKICVSQNCQLDQSRDLKIKNIGAINPTIRYIKSIVQLLKVFWVIVLINTSLILFGKNIWNIDIIVKINEISIPISLFIICLITFISVRLFNYRRQLLSQIKQNTKLFIVLNNNIETNTFIPTIETIGLLSSI